ncbi:hypothetical protein D3C77_655210 [compost metagenome]
MLLGLILSDLLQRVIDLLAGSSVCNLDRNLLGLIGQVKAWFVLALLVQVHEIPSFGDVDHVTKEILTVDR